MGAGQSRRTENKMHRLRFSYCVSVRVETMRPRDTDINACHVEFDAALAAEGFDYWHDRVASCLDRGTHGALVALYAQRKFYPALVSVLSSFEAEAAAYEAPECGDLESDFDTY